ncbi:MAG: DNA polymerase III subunit delta [Flavobacteriales bacterium AspAUS03]
MDPAEKIIADLKAKKWKPIYFLMGEEPYYINVISCWIEENLLSESEKSFDQIIVYGRYTEIHTILTYARRYPMVGPYTVVIVKEAQQLSRNIEDLITYVENSASSTLLVICYKYKTLDKRKKLYKSIQRHGVLFESKKLYEYQIPAWISTKVNKMGYTITEKAGFLLAEHIGADLSRLASELDKLIITLPKGAEITADNIEGSTGISKTYNHFELQKALANKNSLTAYKIMYHFGKNPKDHPLALILGMLYYFFTQLIKYHSLAPTEEVHLAKIFNISPYFLKDYIQAAQHYPLRKTVEIISHLRVADAQSKGIESPTTTEQELLKELIFKILH